MAASPASNALVTQLVETLRALGSSVGSPSAASWRSRRKAIALWPADRPRVELGRLEITRISPTSAEDQRRLVFDPTNRTDGIELSTDPVLLARSAAYAISYERRSRGQ